MDPATMKEYEHNMQRPVRIYGNQRINTVPSLAAEMPWHEDDGDMQDMFASQDDDAGLGLPSPANRFVAGLWQ